LFQETGRSGEALIRRLVDEVEFAGRREQLGSGLDIFIGRTLLQRAELVMELNNTTRHANSHLAIMGKPGVGKTQFLLKILTDIRIQSNFQTNFIYFDYKGDVVDNARFSGPGAGAAFSLAARRAESCQSILSSCRRTTSRPSTCRRARRRRALRRSTASSAPCRRAH
jgi:hypothetical protein